MPTSSAWTRLGNPKYTCHGVFLHSSGWMVKHCGHPTANWPYYIEQPGRTETIVSFNGRGFRTAAIAKLVVEAVVAGQLTISTENCVPGIAAVNATAFGAERRAA